jgi:hypothetical protein
VDLAVDEERALDGIEHGAAAEHVADDDACHQWRPDSEYAPHDELQVALGMAAAQGVELQAEDVSADDEEEKDCGVLVEHEAHDRRVIDERRREQKGVRREHGESRVPAQCLDIATKRAHLAIGQIE